MGRAHFHRLATVATVHRLTTVATLSVVFFASPLSAADRTTCYLPLEVDAVAGVDAVVQTNGQLATDAFGPAAPEGWSAYLRVWQAHHLDPADTHIRRFLGLPLRDSREAVPRHGRAALRWLGWRAGSYQQLSTPHFAIYSRAPESASLAVAADLERCYWVWTQLFFPLWEAESQVSHLLAEMSPQESVSDYLERTQARITVDRKMRVVLFRDAAEYQRTLGRSVPGIERSTGYYNDGSQTIYLYHADRDDAATRRHELVHQLFREATRSGLGKTEMPGEQGDFWLIEGIAGYFESMRLGERSATVGGWDSSRLQFARYRTLAMGDVMPLSELRRDGRVAAQRREDLARWYAHAIAQTHCLMDGKDSDWRKWIYQQLAEHYRIDHQLPAGSPPTDEHQRLIEFLRIDDEHLRQNPIEHPLTELCLARCRVTGAGLDSIPACPSLGWLDLSHLPIGNDAVERLSPAPGSLSQLSLERTLIDPDIDDWLVAALNLRELDLSSTAIDDGVVAALPRGGRLETIWLTATQVTDASIEVIAAIRSLRSVDLQLSGVTPAGIARLQQLRPDLSVNPLEIRRQ